MSLRTKLFLSFLIPTLMWLAVGVWTSSSMRNIGREVTGILNDNERSVKYAVEMVQDLERMDSGILLKINGDVAAFAAITSEASAGYKKALAAAIANITVPGEKELLDTLSRLSDQYFTNLSLIAAKPTLDAYNQTLYPTFVSTRQAISRLREMNTDAMYSAAASIADRAKRAALPGDLMMLAAVFFGLAFVVLSNQYFVKPIKKLIATVSQWNRSGEFDMETVETNDEIQELADGLRNLHQSVASGRR